MADAPRLSSATDAAAKYAPLSGLAVAAAGVAGVFAVVLGVVAVMAVTTGQPILNEWVLVPAGIGLVLAFLGRRQVRTSEGARTGEGYANVGWWVCVVGGACYGAYCLATDFAVRADAERAMTTWANDITQGNPADPDDAKVRAGFLGTTDPGSAAALGKNPKVLYAAPQVALPFAQFRNSQLVQLPARSRESARVTSNGLRKWEITPDGRLLCEVAATLTCPEGEFPLVVPMVGVKPKEGGPRVWQVQPVPGFKYLDPDQGSRTRYGWLTVAVDAIAQGTANQFLDTLKVGQPLGQGAAVRGFLTDRPNLNWAKGVIDTTEGRLGLMGPSAALVGPTDPPAGFFAKPDGTPFTDDEYTRPDGEKRKNGLRKLREVWDEPQGAKLSLAGRGGFLQPEQTARNTVLDFSDPARVRVKVPVEFAPAPEDRTAIYKDEFYRAKGTFAVGWVVLEMTDPAALKQLADARAAGGPASRQPPADLQTARFPLRVVRFETDLLPMVPPQPQKAGGGGGEGG